VSQLEAWQMVLVADNFSQSTHGKNGCTACHKGDKEANDKVSAHQSVVAFPSEDLEETCSGCHALIMSNFKTSQHATLSGYLPSIEKRLGYDISNDPGIMENFNQECFKCHTSCGQCHISRPESVKGGFLNGHEFKKRPSQTNNCIACHGSRVGAEYLGENAGYAADVHRIPHAKLCVDCHDAKEMHSSGSTASHRYENKDMIRCEDCHANSQTSNNYHMVHWDSQQLPKLSCQVCHSQPYKNCNACHTGGDGITGSSYITLKIGKNYIKSAHRNYDYITVRHIPIIQDTYQSWGISDLPHFSAEPTWKYTTPHNIQRWTAQTDTISSGGSCSSNCHNSEYYLRETDLEDYEKDANKDVIIK